MRSFIVAECDHQTQRRLLTFMNPNRFRRPAMMAFWTVVFTFGLTSGHHGRLKAGEHPLDGPQVRPGDPVAIADFVADKRKELRKLREDLVKLQDDSVGLGDARLKNADSPAASEGEIANQSLAVELAKVKLRCAQLNCEVAQMALREYQEGILKEEQASALAELKMAQDDLARAQPRIKEAKERLAKIKQTRGGTTSDLVNVWNQEAREYSVQLEVKKAGLAIEQARSKLKVLEEYERVVHVKRLQSEVEKRKSEELAASASQRLEAVKLTKMQRSQDLAKRGIPLTDAQKRITLLLDEAITIDEKLSQQLDRIEKEGASGDSLRQEVTALTSQLQAIIEKAQIDVAAATLTRLKETIHRQANRRTGRTSR